MHRDIDEIDFTVFDTETTGLEPECGDRIVEIAAARFKGNVSLGTFNTLVNPRRRISPAAYQVNHITDEMLKDAPFIETVAPDFLEFIKGSCLCSYNAGFDLEFLNSELKLISRELPQDLLVVDILKMARRLLPGMERYALWFVADKLGVSKKQEHRALSDVEITIEVFNKLKEIMKLKGISGFGNFCGLFSISPGLLKSLTGERIAQIQEAIELGAKLKIKYLSSSGAQVTEREVMPKEIKMENNQAYLVGFCCLRNEERTFRIDGILHLELI